MDLTTAKKLIQKYEPIHSDFVWRADIARRYYDNQSDILYRKNRHADTDVRRADNRIPQNLYALLVDQKASYLFTAPPVFDCGSEALNDRVAEVLGDEFQKECRQLCVNASNSGVGWVHYWQGEHGLEYATVASEEILPVWSKGLKKQLLTVLRTYTDLDEATGELLVIYEIWTPDEVAAFARPAAETLDMLQEYFCFTEYDDWGNAEPVSVLRHGLGEVPFVAFYNNASHTSDLDKIKRLIDVQDAVFSGFVDDLEDIQELILILTGYGGTDLSGFLDDLKRYKVIKMDADEGSGLDTLKMEIPVEARKTLLDLVRKAIFEIGQGYDPHPESFGNASGVALKFMYASLEMKSGQQESEFRLGFARLVRAICRAAGREPGRIIQTWTRTAITNDLETAQICQMSDGTISRRTILAHHPFVEDVDAEIEQLEAEKAEALARMDAYAGFGGGDGT